MVVRESLLFVPEDKSRNNDASIFLDDIYPLAVKRFIHYAFRKSPGRKTHDFTFTFLRILLPVCLLCCLLLCTRFTRHTPRCRLCLRYFFSRDSFRGELVTHMAPAISTYLPGDQSCIPCSHSAKGTVKFEITADVAKEANPFAGIAPELARHRRLAAGRLSSIRFTSIFVPSLEEPQPSAGCCISFFI